WVALQVAGQSAEALRVGGRRDAEVDLERVDRLAGLLVQAGQALKDRADDVRTPGLRRVHDTWEQDVHDLRQLRVDDELAEVLRVVRGGRRVEPVLLTQGDHDLVDERVAQARDLYPVVSVAVVRVVLADDLNAPAVGRGPHADYGVLVA